MKYAILLSVFFFMSCGQGKKYHDDEETVKVESDLVADILKFQKELDESFKDPDSSPLPDKYRKDFEGLDFCKPDTTYVLKQNLF
jgi:inhibitor of KinA sporulation pathway (predicted exonuclease)